MAKAVLCGLESKPKLNGRPVRLVHFHADRQRWEVELEGEHPMVDLFQIKWKDAWYPLLDDTEPISKEAENTPHFKDVLLENLKKTKVDWKSLTILDSNGRKVWVFDEAGEVLPDLAGPHIQHKSDTVDVVRKSFPLLFQRPPDASKTLAIRPACLRVREDDSVDKIRRQKVEISVNAAHPKPQLDGQFGELGAFVASAGKWAVRPDVASLWDVKVDGSPCPVMLRSSELSEESSGARLVDPVTITRLSGSSKPDRKVVMAAAAFKQGQVICLDEPVLLGKSNSNSAAELHWIWEQFLRLPTDLQSDILDMPKSSNCLRRLPSNGQSMTYNQVANSTEFKALSPEDARRAWRMLQSFDQCLVTHDYAAGKFLFSTLGRLSHSCCPNACLASVQWDPEKHEPVRKALIALHDIDVGEEITISYIEHDGLLLPTAARRQRLFLWYGDCTCKRCKDSQSDCLLRVFQCTSELASSCAGRHAASHEDVLSACSVCGCSVKEPSKVLSEERMHASVLLQLAQSLTVDTAKVTADPLVQIVEGATHSGLAPEHWVVCQSRALLSNVYNKLEQLALAATNIEPLLALQERVLGRRNWAQVEECADKLSHLGELEKAFSLYASALLQCKQLSPEFSPGSLPSCDRLRRKLRLVLDGMTVKQQAAEAR